MAQPSSYQRVGATAADYDATGFPTYLKFDGVDDSLASATFAAGTIPGLTDCLIAVRRDSVEKATVGGYQADHAKFFGIAESGDVNPVSTGAGTPSTWVDGTQLTGGTAVTRGTLHTALTPGSFHILEFRGLDLSAWTSLRYGGYFAGYRLNGALGEIQLFASGQPINRDLARAQMADYYGVTLP